MNLLWCFVLIDLLLKILKLLKLLLLRIENVLLMEDGVAELVMVHSVSQEGLDPVLNDRHLQDFVHIRPQFIVCVQ